MRFQSKNGFDESSSVCLPAAEFEAPTEDDKDEP